MPTDIKRLSRTERAGDGEAPVFLAWALRLAYAALAVALSAFGMLAVTGVVQTSYDFVWTTCALGAGAAGGIAIYHLATAEGSPRRRPPTADWMVFLEWMPVIVLVTGIAATASIPLALIGDHETAAAFVRVLFPLGAAAGAGLAVIPAGQSAAAYLRAARRGLAQDRERGRGRHVF